jgi:hypothetical protein
MRAGRSLPQAVVDRSRCDFADLWCAPGWRQTCKYWIFHFLDLSEFRLLRAGRPRPRQLLSVWICFCRLVPLDPRRWRDPQGSPMGARPLRVRGRRLPVVRRGRRRRLRRLWVRGRSTSRRPSLVSVTATTSAAVSNGWSRSMSRTSARQTRRRRGICAASWPTGALEVELSWRVFVEAVAGGPIDTVGTRADTSSKHCSD